MAESPSDRQVYLNDFDHQHEATWLVLGSAASHRDLVTKIHGTAFGAIVVLTPFLAGRYQTDQLVTVLAVALWALTWAAWVGLRDVLSLRTLQAHLDFAGNYSAALLEATDQPRLFSADPDVVAGRRPYVAPNLGADPMGVIVTTLRTVVQFDLVAGTALSVLALLGGSDPPARVGSLWPVAAAAGLAVAGLARLAIDRLMHRADAKLEAAIDDRLAAIRTPAAGASRSQGITPAR